MKSAEREALTAERDAIHAEHVAARKRGDKAEAIRLARQSEALTLKLNGPVKRQSLKYLSRASQHALNRLRAEGGAR